MEDIKIEKLKVIGDLFVNNFNEGKLDINSLEHKKCIMINYPGTAESFTIKFYKDDKSELYKYLILDEDNMQIYPELPDSIVKMHRNGEENENEEIIKKLKWIVTRECEKHLCTFKDDHNWHALLHEYGEHIIKYMDKGAISLEELPYLRINLDECDTYIVFYKRYGKHFFSIDKDFTPLYSIDIIVN